VTAASRVIAGVDVGNATTEVVLVRDGEVLGSARAPTRGRKGSADSLRGAAAVVRRAERQAGCRADEARVAPLRAVDTSVLTVPAITPAHGRLRILAAGVGTPGGTGVCVGRPVPAAVGRPVPAAVGGGSGGASPDGRPVMLIPAGLRYDDAATLINMWPAAGAVLVAGDEGVLIANRLTAAIPVIDQADVHDAAACDLIAVEVRPPGQPLRLLSDPIALAAGFGLGDDEAADTVAVCRTLADYSNAVVGLLAGDHLPVGPSSGQASAGQASAGQAWAGQREPWVGHDEPWIGTAAGERFPLRAACGLLPGWPPGTVRVLGTDSGQTAVDDLFAVDLAAAAEAATARQGSTGRAVLVASLAGGGPAVSPAEQLAGLLGIPVSSPVTEPAAARLGALSTPGAQAGALVVDLGAGTIDVAGIDGHVVAAGAGELLTAAVAETLGISRAAADWVKRGPCIRVDGGQRYEAEDGSRGFLDTPVPAAAAGQLAVHGPGGLLPFDRRHGPGEWRAIRLRIKQFVLSSNLGRAMRAVTEEPSQILVVGGPAGDEELLAVIARTIAGDIPAGRGNVGGSLGHRYAVAYGLALA
jgi:Diol dehydratase reactivase ATPase-like domain/DD-reactivating factor swiveling domain